MSPSNAVTTLSSNQSDLPPPQQQNFTLLKPILPNVLQIETQQTQPQFSPASSSHLLLSPTPSHNTVPLYITNTSCSSTSSQLMLTSPNDVMSRSASRASSSDGSSADSFASNEVQSTSGLTSSSVTSLTRHQSASPPSPLRAATSPPRHDTMTSHTPSRKRKHVQQVRTNVMNADSTERQSPEEHCKPVMSPPATTTNLSTGSNLNTACHKPPSLEQTWRPW